MQSGSRWDEHTMRKATELVLIAARKDGNAVAIAATAEAGDNPSLEISQRRTRIRDTYARVTGVEAYDSVRAHKLASTDQAPLRSCLDDALTIVNDRVT